MRYLDNTDLVPKHMNTEQAARYILFGPKKNRFTKRTQLRARLVLSNIKRLRKRHK